MVTLFLHGAIDDFSSTKLNDELNFNAMNGEKQITININSEGGSVFKGFGIIDTILTLQKEGIEINTHVSGLAGSMAGVIAMFGNKVTINDFAMLMIHDPSLTGGRVPNEKESNTIGKIRNSLLSIFVNRRSKSEKEMDEIMSNETWFNADESLENGLIDEIIETGVVLPENSMENAIFEIANQLELNENNISKYNQIKMKEICTKIGIEITDNVNSINDGIDTFVDSKVSEINDKVSELENSITEKDEAISSLENKVAEFVNEKAETLISKAIADGKIKEDAKNSWFEKAVENYDETFKLLGSINNRPVNVVDLIDKGSEEKEDKKTFDDYMNEGKAGHLLKNNPEKYANLFKERFGKFPEGYVAGN